MWRLRVIVILRVIIWHKIPVCTARRCRLQRPWKRSTKSYWVAWRRAPARRTLNAFVARSRQEEPISGWHIARCLRRRDKCKYICIEKPTFSTAAGQKYFPARVYISYNIYIYILCYIRSRQYVVRVCVRIITSMKHNLCNGRRSTLSSCRQVVYRASLCGERVVVYARLRLAGTRFPEPGPPLDCRPH